MKLFNAFFPQLFTDSLSKQTVQSVHAQTALGNSKDRKRRSFEEVTAQQSDSVKRPDVEKPTIDDDDDDDIVHGVSPNGKNKSWTLPLQVKKADPDQRLIYGWASVSAIDGERVIDKQGDIIPVEELEKAVVHYALNSRDGGYMHTERGVMKSIASWMFTPEMEKLGFVAKDDKDRAVHGWAVGFYVNNDDVWAAMKRGELPEFSIGGQAVPIDIEALSKA